MAALPSVIFNLTLVIVIVVDTPVFRLSRRHHHRGHRSSLAVPRDRLLSARIQHPSRLVGMASIPARNQRWRRDGRERRRGHDERGVCLVADGAVLVLFLPRVRSLVVLGLVPVVVTVGRHVARPVHVASAAAEICIVGVVLVPHFVRVRLDHGLRSQVRQRSLRLRATSK
eukprot:1348829-Rhodomonas_salina.2